MSAPEPSQTPAAAVDPSKPDLASLPVEERDRAWYKHYYAGDSAPQLTVRAVVMGAVLGMMMSISNLYTTLKLGWAFGVAITACVLSFAIWNAFEKLGLAKTKMTVLENNCMQSTASAAGYSTGGTIATAVGALLMITGDEHRMGPVTLTIWVLLVALLGVFLAIPMKRQMINSEQLPFPSGIAAAETLRSLYAEGAEAVQKARALIGSLVLGIGVGLLRSFEIIKSELPLSFRLFTVGSVPISGAQLGMTFEPSLLLIAAGMIVGIRVSTSMMLGSLVNYLVLSPRVLALANWVAPGKHYMGHMEIALGEHGELAVVKVTRWSLWLGTALMVSSGLTSFALGWKTIVRAFTNMAGGKNKTPAEGPYREGGADDNDRIDAAVNELEVPVRWMLLGGIPVTLGLMALCYFSFGIAPWLGLLSVILSFALALVACRATGETDTTPIGAMGKITQFVFAVLSPANKTINLMTAGITAGAAGSAADLLTDLKSGYLLGANPRKQFIAQFIGSFFGVLAVVPAWYLLVPNRAALEAFHSPATNMWFAVAEALSTGINTIPESARLAIVVGGIIGIILPVIESIFPKARKYLPSSMGLGLAFVVPFANALAFFIGALIAEAWTRTDKASGEKYIVPLASGAVAGEALAAAAYAIMANLGIVHPG